MKHPFATAFVVCATGIAGAAASAMPLETSRHIVRKVYTLAQAAPATSKDNAGPRGAAERIRKDMRQGDGPAAARQKPGAVSTPPNRRPLPRDVAPKSATGGEGKTRAAPSPADRRSMQREAAPGSQSKSGRSETNKDSKAERSPATAKPRQKPGAVATPPNRRPLPRDVAPGRADTKKDPGRAGDADRFGGPREATQGRDRRAAPSGRRPAETATDDRAEPRNLESVRKQRRERRLEGGKTRVIEEPGDRTIVRRGDRMYIRHSERNRFDRFGDVRTIRRKDGTVRSVVERPNGVRIISIYDRNGNLLERRRRAGNGREIVLIDNRGRDRGRLYRNGFYVGAPLALAPLALSIPRERYIVEYSDSSPELLYETLTAPPVQKLERRYTIDEIRYNRELRARLRRIDLDAINFATGSWDAPESEWRELERIARAMKRAIDRNPREIFLVEGHTDAVGDPADNLTLSDRRAEAIASILTQQFGVPPENLVVQGYGEKYLKIDTAQAEARNRRVAIRRVTPLMTSQAR